MREAKVNGRIHIAGAAIASLAFLAGCNGKKLHGGSSAKTDVVELAARLPSPESKAADFQVGDDVAVVSDDGTYDVEARVEAIGGKIVLGNGSQISHASKPSWMPADEVKNAKGDEPSAPKGYQIRVGTGRGADSRWFPPTHVFPAPWAKAAHAKVGDTVYQRRFGDFEPTKCVVTEAPDDPHRDVRARCGTDEQPKSLARKDVFYGFEPATLDGVSPGDQLYFDKMYWVMVVAKKDGKLTIRETGYVAKDKQVDLSRLQIAH